MDGKPLFLPQGQRMSELDSTTVRRILRLTTEEVTRKREEVPNLDHHL
jgi:hypothetical protein